MSDAGGISDVPLPQLEVLLRDVQQGRVGCPLDKTGLIAEGMGDLWEPLGLLRGLNQQAVDALLTAVIHERRSRARSMQLVWTGIDPPGSETRDTAVVVKELFGSAEREVIVGGYSFYKSKKILKPLWKSMLDKGVTCTMFMDVEKAKTRRDKALSDAEWATAKIDKFLRLNWPGAPFPAIYYDPRTVEQGVWVSLHAKCVIVDEQKTLLGSANFTDRGQTRNIEVGVVIDDADFAKRLAGHWRSLVGSGLVERYMG